MAIYCGIDLGTTNSTVSIIEIDKFSIEKPIDKLKTLPIYQLNDQLQVIKDKISLPSSLYFDIDNKNVYTGVYAKQMYASGDRPMQTIRSVKTRIGGESLIEIPSISNENEKVYIDMIQCSSLLVKTIKNSVELQCGQTINGAVVTVPAAFNNDERQATRNAMLLAGFKEVHILDEPTAALLYYINDSENRIDGAQISEDIEYKMVYDIGGGTLDVSIAKMNENEDGDIDLQIVARSPRMDIGGDDFDQYLATYFLADFEAANHPIQNRSVEDQNRIIARIVSNAEIEKIALNEKIKEASNNERALRRLKQYVNFEVINNMEIFGVKLTKNLVDEIFEDLISRNDAKILEPVEKTLLEANLKKEDINEVVLTGGMSNFYAVEETLQKYFGKNTKFVVVDTECAVSKGAAIYHYHQEKDEGIKLKIQDKMADDIFIMQGNEFEILIPRTARPGESGTFKYEIKEDGLCEISVFLYYGLNNNPENYTPISGKFIELKEPKLKGEEIDVNWRLDKNKIIHIYIGELDAEIDVNSSKDYTCEDIKSNYIQQLSINRGGI